MNWRVFCLLCVVALVYLVVVALTYSWMIAAPRKWLVKSQIDRLRATLNVADLVVGNHDICAIVDDALVKVQRSIDKKKGLSRLFRAVNLNELMAAQQTVNGLSRHRAVLFPDSDLPSLAEPVFVKLRAVDRAVADSLRSQFYYPTTSPNARRILISHADELCHAQEDAALRADFDRERASLWLAMVGLWGIIAVGSMFDDVSVLLVGAIGGFLAPLVDIRNSDPKQATWGVRVLSPVGGALTAVAGLIVVAFLAGVGVLAESFKEVTHQPPSTAALALALLFGFSGRLFSSMAITATSQIAGATPAPAPPAGPNQSSLR